MIEEALTSILKTAAGAITMRVYPGTVPQNAELPLIFYVKVSGERDQSLTGPTGLAHPRFQIEAWAETYAAAKGLANVIRTAIDGKSFEIGSDSVLSILIQSERDFSEPDISAHRVIMDYMIWHRE